VFEFTEAPSSSAHALTFTVTAEGATVESGDHLAANTVVRLSYKDAEALTAGSLDSASALREGRLKAWRRPRPGATTELVARRK